MRTPLEFLGDSLEALRGFPESARRRAGYQLDRVQGGLDPDDWKPMSAIGSGVREIRVRDERGIFRVMYVTKLGETVYVLHCFQKKSQKTSRSDLELATRRYLELQKGGFFVSTKYESVWDAIEESPAEAANMKLRAVLMLALREHIAGAGLSQIEAAGLFGVTQPRISDLMRGRIDLFAIDGLVNMLYAAGLRVEMQIRKAA